MCIRDRFYVLPAIITVAMSFTNLDSAFTWKFIGLKNYQKIFRDPNTMTIIRNTALFVLIAITGTVVPVSYTHLESWRT